jgi:anti-anti-sigma factor
MAGAGHHSCEGVPHGAVAPEAVAEPRSVMHLRTGLTVRVTRAPEGTLVSVHGEVDLDCAEMLHGVLADSLRSDPSGVDVDLTGAGFFDCAGLNTLLRARALAEAVGVRLTVGPVSPAVARLLDLTGCRGTFPDAVVRGEGRRRDGAKRVRAAELVATG